MPLLADVAFVGVHLLARVALIKYFVKVMSVMLAGCAYRNTTDKAMLVIHADAELVAKVAFAMLLGMHGIEVFLTLFGITPLGRLISSKFAAFVSAYVQH